MHMLASCQKQAFFKNNLNFQMNEEMAPTKKQNAQLMNIINAAEKGHNLLLNTMQTINNDIAGQL